VATSIDAGCVPGNCSWRPKDDTAEHRLWMQRRTNLPVGHAMRLAGVSAF
jgi:hypothetical protein